MKALNGARMRTAAAAAACAALALGATGCVGGTVGKATAQGCDEAPADWGLRWTPS